MDSSMGQAAASAWPRDRIERFLAEEKLKYQKIDLPFGLSTAGNDRKRMFEIAFEGDLTGKSVLDVGSYLGAFCIEAIVRILQDHMKKYWKVETFTTERDRFAVRATKLSIDRLTFVSGPSAAGKSVLLTALKDGQLDGTLGSPATNLPVVLSAQNVSERRFSDLFAANPVSHLIYHYDTTRPLKYNFHSFSRDLATDLVDCAKAIDFIIVAPRASTLRQQMEASKIALAEGNKMKMKVRKRILEHYERDGW